ncbi:MULTISPECIES: hypothetical protein [unclassified Oleiphilus]|uniref:hypothetical protein n=3 Tax=Oleiphilus TaxID=141450 RepID=UPI0007C26029|nr:MULTISPECIES: hypothetical protein [unclassified Oleiphilus]KZZ32136.1 hypothetical protein A3757_05050 [Oleiphilus sp. HI0117]KZZ35600.1 hypothetical protein A3756_02305 [Oleiphilus sp. HI0086]
MSRILPFLLFFSVLSGCSINKPIQTLDPALISDDSFGEYELYADLVKTGDKWYFTNINDSRGEILLNNLTLHTLSHTEHKRCHRGIFGLTSGNCEEIDSNWLAYKPMERNLILFPISWALAPIGIPISWANGDFTDIDVFFFPVQVIPTFDNKALKQAIDQAAQLQDNNSMIDDIGNLYYEIKENSKNASYDYPKSNGEELTNLVDEFKKNQKAAVRNYLKENLSLVLTDNSGLLNKEAPNPNYLAKPIITIQELEQDFLYPEIKPLAQTKDLITSLLPADSLGELQSRLQRAKTELMNREISNNSIYNQNIALIKQTNALNVDNFLQFKKASLTNKFTIDWKISPSSKFLLKDMDYQIELPPKLVLSQSELDFEPYLNLIINSINYKPALPNNHVEEDSYLRASLHKDHIEFTNKSDSSIELDSLKLSLNGFLIETELNKPLKKGETYKHFLTKANLKTYSPLFSGLTKEQADKTKVLTTLIIDYRHDTGSHTLNGQNEESPLTTLLQN